MTPVSPAARGRPDTTGIRADDGIARKIAIRLRKRNICIRSFFRINSLKYKNTTAVWYIREQRVGNHSQSKSK